MKWIDQHGRFFGCLNVIDALAVAFLIGLMPMIAAGYRITSGRWEAAVSRGLKFDKPEVQTPEWEFMNVEAVMAIDTPMTYIELHPGIHGNAESEFPDMIVVAMRGYSVPGLNPKIAPVDFSSVPPWPKLVLMRFRVACRERNGILRYTEGPLQLGGPFTFRTDEFTLTGKVTDLAATRWTTGAP